MNRRRCSRRQRTPPPPPPLPLSPPPPSRESLVLIVRDRLKTVRRRAVSRSRRSVFIALYQLLLLCAVFNWVSSDVVGVRSRSECHDENPSVLRLHCARLGQRRRPVPVRLYRRRRRWPPQASDNWWTDHLWERRLSDGTP